MKTKNIYIIRHGQTDYNLNNMVQGRGIDSSLNHNGERQAKDFFEVYKHLKFEKVYISALRRTKESIQGFIDLGVPFESRDGFDEISWGKHEGKLYDSEMHQIYLDVVDSWSKGNLNERVGGGESPLEVMNRQKQVMSELIMAREDNILIATHGRAIRILICWLLNYPLEFMDVFEHENLCLYQVCYSGMNYRLIKRADINHLK